MLGKRYRSVDGTIIEAIRDVSFELVQGEVLAILGPTGCGKSTLLRLISGVEAPSEGTIERDKDSTFNIGFIFQDSSLMRWRTVYDNIKLPLEILGRNDPKKVDELIHTVNLTGFENAYPAELSGGMRRRAAIARSLVHEPNVLLMDEPLTGLDEITKEVLQTELSYLIRKMKVTCVLVTHDIGEAVILSDRVLVMSPRPGTLVDEVRVQLPSVREPAVRSDERFSDYCMFIRKRLNILHPLREREPH